MSMLNKLFGKPKQESNALQTLDKLNEVSWRIQYLPIEFPLPTFVFLGIRDFSGVFETTNLAKSRGGSEGSFRIS